MKDYNALRQLLEILQEVGNNLTTSKGYYVEYLQDETAKQESLQKDENGSYFVMKDGERQELSSWDVERISDHIRDYTAKIKAYDIVLNTLSSIDLNKVKM